MEREMVNPREIKDQGGGWLPHRILKRSGEGGYLTRCSQIRKGGYLTRYSQIRGGWIPQKIQIRGGCLPHKILTDQGKLATSRVIRLEGLTSREKIESMRINCKPHHGIHVGGH